jgi:hypothetical protein
LLIARDVGQLCERLQFLEQNGHPVVKLVNAVREYEEFGFSLSPMRQRVAEPPPLASRGRRSTAPDRVCKTGGPGATPRGQGLTDLVHVDEDDWRGEEREHLGHQQSADDRIA